MHPARQYSASWITTVRGWILLSIFTVLVGAVTLRGEGYTSTDPKATASDQYKALEAERNELYDKILDNKAVELPLAEQVTELKRQRDEHWTEFKRLTEKDENGSLSRKEQETLERHAIASKDLGIKEEQKRKELQLLREKRTDLKQRMDEIEKLQREMRDNNDGVPPGWEKGAATRPSGRDADTAKPTHAESAYSYLSGTWTVRNITLGTSSSVALKVEGSKLTMKGKFTWQGKVENNEVVLTRLIMSMDDMGPFEKGKEPPDSVKKVVLKNNPKMEHRLRIISPAKMRGEMINPYVEWNSDTGQLVRYDPAMKDEVEWEKTSPTSDLK